MTWGLDSLDYHMSLHYMWRFLLNQHSGVQYCELRSSTSFSIRIDGCANRQVQTFDGPSMTKTKRHMEQRGIDSIFSVSFQKNAVKWLINFDQLIKNSKITAGPWRKKWWHHFPNKKWYVLRKKNVFLKIQCVTSLSELNLIENLSGGADSYNVFVQMKRIKIRGGCSSYCKDTCM